MKHFRIKCKFFQELFVENDDLDLILTLKLTLDNIFDICMSTVLRTFIWFHQKSHIYKTPSRFLSFGCKKTDAYSFYKLNYHS